MDKMTKIMQLYVYGPPLTSNWEQKKHREEQEKLIEKHKQQQCKTCAKNAKVPSKQMCPVIESILRQLQPPSIRQFTVVTYPKKFPRPGQWK